MTAKAISRLIVAIASSKSLRSPFPTPNITPMKKYRLPYRAIALAYITAYCDWLQPGYLKFGLPAAWNQPLTTATTYDLSASVHHTAKCAVLETIPNWAKPSNWRIGPRTEEPKDLPTAAARSRGGRMISNRCPSHIEPALWQQMSADARYQAQETARAASGLMDFVRLLLIAPPPVAVHSFACLSRG